MKSFKKYFSSKIFFLSYYSDVAYKIRKPIKQSLFLFVMSEILKHFAGHFCHHLSFILISDLLKPNLIFNIVFGFIILIHFFPNFEIAKDYVSLGYIFHLKLYWQSNSCLKTIYIPQCRNR